MTVILVPSRGLQDRRLNSDPTWKADGAANVYKILTNFCSFDQLIVSLPRLNYCQPYISQNCLFIKVEFLFFFWGGGGGGQKSRQYFLTIFFVFLLIMSVVACKPTLSQKLCFQELPQLSRARVDQNKYVLLYEIQMQ